MSIGSLPAEQIVRNTSDGVPVSNSMVSFRAAVPLIRALILAGIVIALIMFGLPRMLAIAAAAPL